MPFQPSVVIVGAGMAGLTCAVYLKQAGIDALIVEASDGVGGRVRTDSVDGFCLDRGFQILLTAYPETKRLLDYNALHLQAFRPGALIRDEARWLPFLNPLREPSALLQSLTSPVGSFADKLRVVELMRRVGDTASSDLFRQQPVTTQSFLEAFGYSDSLINQFFRPFFGGVFLEDELRTSSNFFEFCFKTFYAGDAAVPARGMQAIPEQLASRLAPEQIRLNTAVQHIDGRTIRLTSGETLQAETVVLAVDAAAANRLLGQSAQRAFNKTTCTYFAAPASPKPDKLLMLNPHRHFSVHHVAVMSDVAPTYAPDGQALISVSTQGLDTINEEGLAAHIRQELTGWFGDEVKSWRRLRTYHLPEALPQYTPETRHAPLKVTETLYQCGDQTAYPSLNAAMQTGRHVAEAIQQAKR